MRTITRMTLVAILLAALAGCSSITVNHDYDSEADFTTYRTFGWMPRSGQAPGTAAEAKTMSDLLDRRIRNAVEGELTARGLTLSDAQPDLEVVYHVGAQDKIQVTDWGYRYSDYYWGYGGRQIDVYQYTEGTLVIDLVDAAADNLVWRGSGTGVVDNTQRSPEEMQDRMNEIVAKIMQSFPPK